MLKLNALCIVMVGCVLGLVPNPTRAEADRARALPAGEAVVAAEGPEQLQLAGSKAALARVGSVESVVDGRTRPVKSVRVPPEAVGDPWSVQLNAPIHRPVNRGDRLLATFHVRCVESMTGHGLVMFTFEKASPPHDKSASVQVGASERWRRYHVPFEARADYAPGEAQVTLQMGMIDQTIEVAGLEVTNYGESVALEDLPRTRITYRGWEPDAAWRDEAASRIEKHRKGDLRVRVVDGQGQPAAGVAVRVQMQRHAYRFGSALAVRALLASGEDGDRYRARVERWFNEAVFENAMKWRNHGTATLDEIDQALSWLADRDITARGHVMVWPGWRWLPDPLESLRDDPDALRQAVDQRVIDAATRYRGRLLDWDVLNEPYSNRDLMDVLGDRETARWFRLAHEHDPDTTLYINDYGILTHGDRSSSPHQDAYFEIIKGLIDAGAPVQGIGMQGHFGSSLTPPQRLWETLDRFATFGLPIKITELDIDLTDRELQADYLRDFMTAVFAHPATEGIIMWGFWEARHWRPEAALFDRQWNRRPVADAWERLVFERWWTDEPVTTDAQGEAMVRGFCGEYRVTADVDGSSVQQTVTLTREGTEIELALPTGVSDGAR